MRVHKTLMWDYCKKKKEKVTLKHKVSIMLVYPWNICASQKGIGNPM